MFDPTGRHRVAVLVLPGVYPLEFGTAMQAFGAEDSYEVVACAESPGNPVPGSGFSVSVPAGLETLTWADTVVVPGCDQVSIEPSGAVLEALRRAHDRGARIVAICSAAFVLAAAGLLGGRRVTTHWQRGAELSRRYPDVIVDATRLYIDDGDILTSAGVTAGVDLCLHVIRSDLGAAAANMRARALVASPHRQGDQRQYVDRLVPEASSDSLAGLREWLLGHLELQHDVDALARRSHLSRRTFLRHFRQETGLSPVAWLTSARLDRARVLLESTDTSVEEVGRLSGLGAPATVRSIFGRRLGTSPREYRALFRHLPPAPHLVDEEPDEVAATHDHGDDTDRE